MTTIPYWHTLWETAVTVAAAAIGIAFLAYLIVAALYPLWEHKR